MGRGGVHHRGVECRDMYGVQRIGIAGALDILHAQAVLLHGLSHPPHQGGFSTARPALEEKIVLHWPGGEQLVIDGIKPLWGIGSQIELNPWRCTHRKDPPFR